MKPYLSLLIIILSLSPLRSDDTAALQRLRESLDVLRSEQAALLFPRALQRIETDLADIRDGAVAPTHIERLTRDAADLLESLRRTRATLAETLERRTGVIRAGAEAFATTTFSQAESLLQEAARAVAAGENDRAARLADGARDRYEQAEIETIRNFRIGEMRIILQESADLQAERHCPTLFRDTRRGLARLQVLLSASPPDYHAISTAAATLRLRAETLLSTARLLTVLTAEDGAGETRLNAWRDQLGELSAALGTAVDPSRSIADILADLHIAATALREDNAWLQERNRRLETRTADLEQELLRYKDLASQNRQLRDKIEQLKSRYPGDIEETNGYLIVRLTPFSFPGEQADLTVAHQNTLLSLLEILHEFPETPVLVRFTQTATGDPSALERLLATQRARSVGDFLSARALLDADRIHAIGIAENNTGASSRVEIRLDLYPYWSAGGPARPTETDP